ncbi:DUF3397 domain-containing protein [Chryseomicrobium palamuruense]|uniref:DUF3397 domain-containing protein n=1 Tax=Chryseomicrobium palamuruense TaxID=682973 RepID=A0ABV8UST1_9BACL
MNTIESILSVFIIFPVLVFIIVWFIGKMMGIRKKRRTGLAADITTIALFFAVAIVYDSLSFPNVMTNLLLFLVLIAIILVIVLWKNKSDVGPRVIFRLLWRIYFLVLSILYFLGWVFGIFQSITEYVSG